MILVIGAGPAGLSVAHHLRHRDYLILEREAEAGGLCRSFDLDGAMFDLGGHAFFTKHQYVRDLVTELCAEGLYRQPRRAWVHSHGTLLPYPFQTNLFGLPVDVVEDCLTGLFDAVAGGPNTAPAASVEEWIAQSFGAGIAEHFMTPYNEKVWAFPLSEVSPDWVGNRIVSPDARAVVAGALRRSGFADFPNATVTYPASGGFFNLYRGFLSGVGDRLRHASVARIDLPRRRVETSAGEAFDYDVLCSTMPLTELVERAEGIGACCRAAAASLRHNSLHLVNLALDRPSLTDMQRLYSADPAIPFHKLVFNTNSSDSLRAGSRFAVQAEVSWSTHKEVSPSGLTERVVDALLAIGILDSRAAVAASSVVSLPHAYPVYTADTAAARQHLLDCLARHRVLCAGRFGEWLYINSDDAVMRGKVRAEQINAMRPH